MCKLSSGLGKAVGEKPDSFSSRSFAFGALGSFISAQDVDGWIVGLKESLGTMLAPVGAIFLVVFGDGFLSAYQCAFQLSGGQFRLSYLAPCSIGFEWRFQANEIRGL